MMGSRRTFEKDEPPTSDNPLIQANSIAPNIRSVRSVTFQEGNVSAGHLESVPYTYTPLLNAAGWENLYSMNQATTQGIPETSGNPFMNPNSFPNPQVNLNSSTANTDLPEVPLLPEWNIRWSPQYINQEHNAISAGGMNDGTGISNFENPWSSKNPTVARNFGGDLQMNRQAGEPKFGPFNRAQLDADFVHSPLHYRPRDTAPYPSRNNVNFNTSQCGVQGKVEGGFLSLGIGGTKETIPSSQEVSDKLKEAASAELMMARARKAMGQTLDANFTGLDRNASGFSTFSNQLGHVDRMTLTNNEVGVHSTPNSGLGSSPYHILEMQQNDTQHGISRHDDSNSNFLSSRNISHGNSNLHRVLVANQAVHLGTLGDNSAQLPNSHQQCLNRVAPESGKPSWTMSHTPSGQLQNIRFKTANSQPSETSMTPPLGLGSSSTRQNYAAKKGKHHTPTQGPGGGLYSHRTAVPQVSWVSSDQAVTDLPFPKRLGVEFKGRDSPQAADRHLASRGTCLQTTSTGQICQFPDKGSTRLPDHVLRPSIDQTSGAPVNCPLNSQEPFSAHGQTQDVHIQLAKDLRGVASTTASTVGGLSHKSDFYARPYHKRTAVAPPPAPHWVQRQKMTHPTIHQHPTVHQSVPIRFPTRPAIPVTTTLVHPSIPVAQSQTQRALAVAAPVNPSIPCTSSFKPCIPVTTAPVVSHITCKDPDTTPQLSRYKCLLCKRDLSLTSEGAVYQPTAPPPVAVLPCGHTFHDQCLQKITPTDQAKDPPCIPCAIGEN